MKEKGYIRAVGLSTHFISGVYGAIQYKDYIDILHPIFNINGLGIVDGNIDKMIESIKIARDKDMGIFTMKPIGGGNLINRAKQSLEFVRDNKCIDSVAIGMQSTFEIDYNIDVFEGIDPDEKTVQNIKNTKRKLIIGDWCTGCRKCVERCFNSAIEIKNKKAVVDEKKCLLCGYCQKVCPEFCIKII